MPRLLMISICLILLTGLVAGCSSSNGTKEEATPAAVPVKKAQTPPQRQTASPEKQLPGMQKVGNKKIQGFVAQDDTIEAQIISQQWVVKKNPPSVPQRRKDKYYSVQVGAFSLQENANRCKTLSASRFKKPVITLYERGIKMTRVLVGDFAQLPEAEAFMKAIQQQYSKEYKEAWVAEMKK
jgi:cell division septation protein DedD